MCIARSITPISMHRAFILCLILVASTSGAPLMPISIPNLLIQLNMTFSELFPSHLNASDFVYTYSQSAARIRGPAYDGGTIDVVGCSGMKESCPSGGGEVSETQTSSPLFPPSPSLPVPQQSKHAVLQKLRPLPKGNLAAFSRDRVPQYAALLRPQPCRRPILP
jgi:hypothetical protein